MGPFLVEYSEDDDTGCGFGVVVIAGLVALVGLVLRLAVAGIASRR